jgi:hypothetical protein
MRVPSAQSGGARCVSIRNYEQFLNAFIKGEVKRLVVVPSLGDGMSAATRWSSSPS